MVGTAAASPKAFASPYLTRSASNSSAWRMATYAKTYGASGNRRWQARQPLLATCRSATWPRLHGTPVKYHFSPRALASSRLMVSMGPVHPHGSSLPKGPDSKGTPSGLVRKALPAHGRKRSSRPMAEYCCYLLNMWQWAAKCRTVASPRVAPLQRLRI